MQGSLNAVVIWIPLIDINKDLGALEIMPGSHLRGLRTDHIENGFGMVKLDENEETKLTSIEVKTGDILLFSSFLIHQSGNNITDKPRWSCHFRYNDLNDSSFIKRKYAHPYIYKPLEELITENLGFHKTESSDAIIKVNKLNKNEIVEIRVPELLKNNTSYFLKKWNVKIGDIVKTGDILCEIETNLYSLEFESYNNGKITYLHNDKSNVSVNDLLAIIEGV